MAPSISEPSTHVTIPTPIRALLVGGLIYLFLVGVSSLEKGIKIMGADTQERLFESVSNPIAGLCIGILGTVLVQSSSASTAVIVGLVATGNVTVDEAVPMIMGANVGTTVTNTLVSLGYVRQGPEFKRAFAAATVHDFFNVFAVLILLPIELLTGVLSRIATWITDLLLGSSGSDWKSPIKAWVKAPVEWIIDIWRTVGLNGNWLGTAVVLTGLAIVLLSLTFITKNMRQLVADRVERSINTVLGRGSGSVAMLLGLMITIAVQSSSITTSIMIPLCAAGVLKLRNAYPVTLGANVGTTITALLAALATSVPAALTIALVHTTFNIVAILILYVPPWWRYIPVIAAERLADVAVKQRLWAVAYVMGAFIVLPLIGVAVLR
ncbi:MAG: sodium dependent phosphate transporter [Ilumatobacter sp.]|nr:Na/Pi symporter [bacterium]NKB41242.1 sodium dependent phosphate transporter [Ilumatobacter sp.]